MAQEHPHSEDLFVDDFYFSALIDDLEDQEFAVSDAKYAEELQLQEAIMASVITNNDNRVQDPGPSSSKASEDAIMEEGETSESVCEICAEKREVEEMMRSGNCCHSFCCHCISKHVAMKIQENMRMVACPAESCKGVIEAEKCRGMVDGQVMQRWDEAISLSVIGAEEKFFCPFKDCSALLVDDNGGEVIRESECPVCRRLFCAACYVPWHPGVDCEEYQALNEDERGREDLMLKELAEQKKWKRCPQCKYFVEKTEGCLHITCRCMFQFCYGCGAQWTSNHGGCQRL